MSINPVRQIQGKRVDFPYLAICSICVKGSGTTTQKRGFMVNWEGQISYYPVHLLPFHTLHLILIGILIYPQIQLSSTLV